MGSGSAGGAQGLHQLRRLQQLAAILALVATGSLVAAGGTGAPHVAVGEEPSAGIAVELLDGLVRDVAVLLEVEEYGLCDGRMLRRRCAAELVEGYAEPGIDVAVQDVEPVAEFAGAYALLLGLGFGGRAVLVGSADVEGVVSPRSAEAREHVSRKHLDEIPEMGDIIDVGQCRSDESAFHISAQYPWSKGVSRMRPRGSIVGTWLYRCFC